MKEVISRVWMVPLLVCWGSSWMGATEAGADGFRNPPPSAQGLGQVGSRYTLIDDASATAFNPANLTDVEKTDLLLSITAARSDKDFTAPTGEKAELKEKWYVMPSAYAAWALEKKGWVAGIGVTTPYGQGSEFKQDSYFRYTAPYFAEMRSVNINPTLTAPLSDSLALGVGLDVLWSDLDLRQIFPWSQVVGNPAAPDGQARFEGDGVGFGGNLGLTWRVTEKQRVALVYRSAIDVDYEGDFTVSQIPGAGTPASFPASPRSDFDTTIKFPNMVAIGYGVELTDSLSVGAEVEWFEWSRYESLTLDAGANASLLPVPTTPQNWEDTINAGVGASYRLCDTWTARAGYIYLQTPVPDSTMLPVLAENDQHVITVGLGYKDGDNRFDVAYGLGIYEDREIGNNQNPAYNGTYEFQSQLLALSYGRTF